MEVETTNRRKYQPFYIGENEIESSRDFREQ